MKPSYECHITAKNDVTQEKKWKGLAAIWGWKTSFIIGDPILPDQTGYFYFTCHDSNFGRMKRRMNHFIEKLEFDSKVIIVREKIEKIVHDRRFNAQ